MTELDSKLVGKRERYRRARVQICTAYTVNAVNVIQPYAERQPSPQKNTFHADHNLLGDIPLAIGPAASIYQLRGYVSESNGVFADAVDKVDNEDLTRIHAA